MIRTLTIVIVATLLPLHALAQVPENPAAISNDSTIRWMSADSALTSLINTGLHNEVPLGIVIQGDSLCTHQVNAANSDLTVSELVQKIEGNIPGYTGEIRNGVLFVHPKTPKPSMLRLLRLDIPHFSSAPASAQKLGVGLWMYIRAVLVPREGTGFVGGLQRDADLLPSIEVSNATVESILDLIVSKRSGGFWVMHEIPTGWDADPETMPYEIFSYSGDQHGVRAVTCSP